ncbi:2-succinyl-5-enolpyruvyl-6-hydroxy-3-cyclohexene-1-carboxylic-acid synthase [Corynebacterium sp. sy039]|uniref:2-succinyl-5-enolpyruvyl-6-hydroxy-3- cyclohexene-1-carboxylic-acid synthase n=1 Tax=Corynebacterium sp. sy039 TaxID=2599641 RepID=UPI0011B5C341|nr:2-succinyl-5-enolpyruvyl-6-hydroxy-3-cyclohexene-1-carboxylic-acid synthase [Corynebacterium sp. sy039]QDZ43231.1 2-succinyl-5-enolpyruvyl-6-hydroxy-3-cyclohexene-1-carboxylic-acid synthase [Corynebacterium sp. sy039]
MMSSSELARYIAAELARHLTDIVICPGSRNSALSLALLARSDIRVHTRIDERSAAFFALGMSRQHHKDHRPRQVAVLTTSGTAVANCLPALIEAQYAHIPLAIISADRPQQLHGCGANQTIEQQGLFGARIPHTHIEQSHITTQAAITERIAATFQHPQVHLNIAFDTPLVEHSLSENITERATTTRPVFPQVDHGEIRVDLSQNTLVIAGDEAWEIEQLQEVPTIAEPTAPAPYRPVHPLAAGIFATEQISGQGYVVETKPQQVIVVGHPTLHRDVLALMSDPDIKVFVLSRTEVITDPAHNAHAVGSRITTTGEPSAQWLKICEAASQLGVQAVREVLEDPTYEFSGLHVLAAVGDTLATGDWLFLGASNPIRDASLIGLPFDAIPTLSPRGTAGIDGCVSQSMGMATAVQAAHPDQIRAPRSVAVLGDVTFLHDVGGLLIPHDSARPENLTIVVANDNGGGIFSTLEVGDSAYRSGFERAFGTPHGVHIEDIAAAYEIDYQQVTSTQELIEALIDATDVPGLRIIEAVTSRNTRRQMHEALAAKVTMHHE